MGRKSDLCYWPEVDRVSCKKYLFLKDNFKIHIVTCDLNQYGFALHPGPGVIIAVPCTAAVKPRLLWAQTGHKKGSSTVGKGVVMQQRLSMRVHVCLRGEDRSIQQPGHMRKSPPADATPQPGTCQFGIGSVQIIHLHYHIASDWDWSNSRQKRRPSG